MFLKRLRLLRALMLSLLLLASFNSRLSAQLTWRIGVIDQPDGAMLAGARLAADHVNAAGGIIGGDGRTYELLVVDTPPDHMEIAIANMRQASVIAVIGPLTNQDLSQNMPGLQALNAPIFTPATGDTALLMDSSNRIFRSRAQESRKSSALADYLVKSRNVNSIQTVQLDNASTSNLITLANALAAYGIRPQNLRYDRARLNLNLIGASIAETTPDAVAIYGPPAIAAQAYNAIRIAGYSGDIIYTQADHPDFVEVVPTASLPGLISATTWSYSLDDAASRDFTVAYARAFGKLPDALSAAGYDSVRLLAKAAGGRGPLPDQIAAIQSFRGLQGALDPAGLPRGETSSNVIVTRLNEYGTPNVAARYSGAEPSAGQLQTSASPTSIPQPTATALPTATPAGFHLIIQSQFQNIRSGPGLEYEIIGQALQGARLPVLGATDDSNWLVIDYRGQWGWVAAYLVETVGNRNLAPIFEPPATPTPAPTATTPPPREPDLLVLSVSPARITLGQSSPINVTVLNQGLSPAGNFAIAGTFQPGSRYAGVNQPGLGAGQQATLQLQPVVAGPSGPQSVVIVVDLNQEVYEGAAGEANNQVYRYSYIADRPIHASDNWTIAPGSFDLDGDGASDFSWTGNDLVAQGNAGMLLMNQFSALSDLHYDAINVSQAQIKTLDADLLQNSTIGIVTADGRRGAMRLTNVTRNGSITVQYRVYR